MFTYRPFGVGQPAEVNFVFCVVTVWYVVVLWCSVVIVNKSCLSLTSSVPEFFGVNVVGRVLCCDNVVWCGLSVMVFRCNS